MTLRFVCLAVLVAATSSCSRAEPQTARAARSVAAEARAAAEPDGAASTPAADPAAGAGWDKRAAAYEQRIRTLQAELDVEKRRRQERELEWLEFTRAIQSFGVEGVPDAPGFLGLEDEVDPAAEQAAREAAAAAEARAKRAQQVLIDLRVLLTAEQVLGLDFLEAGQIEDDWTGPVIVRLVDDWGRPSGTLAADRLKLECSQTGRSVTLVFEQGFESRGGLATPFGPPYDETGKRGGVRRIYLPNVDPAPWIEAFPELLSGAQADVLPDDGQWNLTALRATLNDLLRLETRSGIWRLRALGGVLENRLREVHLAEYDESNHVIRRLFADSLLIEREGESIRFVLHDGIQERHGRSTPFLEGEYELWFPSANEEWQHAELPFVATATPSLEDERKPELGE